MADNLLGSETSPYLLQHADNPVAWMPWGPAALDQARTLDRPILLSVGYSACHWCHVMAHESFEDPAIAAQMNAGFVCIKVDREERPDLDTIYQSALAMLGQPGGWPLTMFLTPDGRPFWGGTYFPPESRYGRPGFPDVLRAVVELYANGRDRIDQNVAALADGLARLSQNRRGPGPTREVLDRIADRLCAEVDTVWGGIGSAPKFPQVPILLLLWRAWLRRRDARLRDAVEVSLTRMCQGGIYDHLRGGFARYATDDEWLVPHFEKMLYDNAQLLRLLTLVWQDTRNELFAVRIAETVDWLLAEMVDADGAFASTLDADSEGEEGRFYVWQEDEIDRLLPAEDAALFKHHYDVAPGGNWEGRTILNRRLEDRLLDPAREARLAEARARLLAARAQRPRPGWDDKVLADWNGLMIAALADAALVFDRADWLAAAARAFQAVSTTLVDTARGPDRLHQSARHGQARHAGTLDAYVQMARAGLALHEATGDAAPLDRAMAWVEAIERHFRDGETGGYFLTADDAESLIVRTKTAYDGATPAAAGTLLEVLSLLHRLTAEPRYADRAAALINAFSGEVERNFFPLATFLNAVEDTEDGRQIVLVGKTDDPALATLRRTALGASLPDRCMVVVAPDNPLPPTHPAYGKTPLGGQATAYVCRGPTCRAPITDPAALADALREP